MRLSETQLFKRVCQVVQRSAGPFFNPSVGPFDRPSIWPLHWKITFFGTFQLLHTKPNAFWDALRSNYLYVPPFICPFIYLTFLAPKSICARTESGRIVWSGFFSVACTRLYDWPCQSVGWSVDPSLFAFSHFLHNCIYPNAWLAFFSYYPCPHVIAVAVFAALFLSFALDVQLIPRRSFRS